ncbi:MAG: AAA family ATPase [Candidatus Nitrosocaldaceae archaeon]
MMLNTLSMNGFLCFKEKSIRFDKTTLLFGPNGSGKTSIIDAIYFALYGKTIRPLPIINKESDKASVTLEFSVKDQNYKIKRDLDKDSKSNVELIKNNEVISDINKTIIDLFDSSENFMKKCIIDENYLRILEYDTLNALTITFGLDTYGRYLKEIEKRIKERELYHSSSVKSSNLIEKLNNEVKELEVFVEDIKKRIEDIKRSGLEEYKSKENITISKRLAELEELKREKEKRLNEIDIASYNSLRNDYKKLTQLRKSIAQLEEKKVKYDILTNNILLIENEINEKNNAYTKLLESIEEEKKKDVSSEVSKLRREMLELDKKKIELETNVYRLYAELSLDKKRLNDITDRVDEIKVSKQCPICLKLVDTDILSHIKDEENALKDIIDSKEKELSQLSSELRNVDKNLHKTENLLAKTEEDSSRTIKELELKIRYMKEEIDELNKKLSSYKSSLSKLKFNNEYFLDEKEKYKQLVDANVEERYLIATAERREAQYLKSDLNRLESMINMIKRLSSIQKNNEPNISDVRDELIRLEAIKGCYETLLAKKREELASETSRVEKSELNIVDESMNDLKKLNDILRESLINTIEKTIESIKRYIDEFANALNITLSYANNTIFLNNIPIDNLSRGEKALSYLILRLSYIKALNTKLVIMDESASIIDYYRLSIILNKLDIQSIVTSHHDLSPFFKHVVKLRI